MVIRTLAKALPSIYEPQPHVTAAARILHMLLETASLGYHRIRALAMTPVNSPKICTGLAIAFALVLPGCNTFERLSEVGSGPSLSQIEDPRTRAGYQPVSMPMPAPSVSQHGPNSLWRTGARDFFRDHRASQVGDILTVFVQTAGDAAAIADGSSHQRGAGAQANADAVPVPVLPPAIAAGFAKFFGNQAIQIGPSASGNSGGGAIAKAQVITMRLAAVVTQILQNGNLVISGKQEIKVASELREMTITGVVRPDDIDSLNQISYERIAEARISYGGKGYLSDVQQPRYGFDLLDVILPF